MAFVSLEPADPSKDQAIFDGDAADPFFGERLADFFERLLDRRPADFKHVDQ